MVLRQGQGQVNRMKRKGRRQGQGLDRTEPNTESSLLTEGGPWREKQRRRELESERWRSNRQINSREKRWLHHAEGSLYDKRPSTKALSSHVSRTTDGVNGQPLCIPWTGRYLL